MGTDGPDTNPSDWQLAHEISHGERPVTYLRPKDEVALLPDEEAVRRAMAGDYGGKTREQEAKDSAFMLGWALVVLIVVLIVLVPVAVWAASAR